MPVHHYACAQCSGLFESAQGLCPTCGQPATRQANVQAFHFIPQRDRAVNSGQNARYRDWLRSPETQARIARGELVPERPTNTHPLVDHLDCLQ